MAWMWPQQFQKELYCQHLQTIRAQVLQNCCKSGIKSSPSVFCTYLLLISGIKKMSRHIYMSTQAPGLGIIQSLDPCSLMWRLLFHMSLLQTGLFWCPSSISKQPEYNWSLLRLCEAPRRKLSVSLRIFLHQDANSPV